MMLVSATQGRLLWQHTCSKFTLKQHIPSRRLRISTVTPNFFLALFYLGHRLTVGKKQKDSVELKKNYRQKCHFCHFENIGSTEFFYLFFVR